MQCQLFCEIRSHPDKYCCLSPFSLTHTLQSYLCEVEVEEAEGEELQAHWAAVQEPVGQRLQLVGLHHILEVEREEGGPQGCPQQAQEQEDALVAEALVSVVQDEPELQVDENKQGRVEDGVDGGQAELQCGGDRTSTGLLQ